METEPEWKAADAARRSADVTKHEIEHAVTFHAEAQLIRPAETRLQRRCRC
jgi:hypothetical protein